MSSTSDQSGHVTQLLERWGGGDRSALEELLHVASGQVEETYKSEKDAGDVFAMQDAVADEVGTFF
jgi:hypothetical protein